MATEISWQIKVNEKSGLITRDFLGGCSGIDSKELDLDLHVPQGWEKRLDLKSGQVYIERCNPPNSTNWTSNHNKNSTNQISSKLHDLTSFPKPSSASSPNITHTLNLLHHPSLNLNLLSNSSPSSYTSVCTLDKVKSALDRAERLSPSSSSSSRKRWMMSSSSNSSSLSIKETEEEVVEKGPISPSDQSGLLLATACPGCFLYVLVSKNDPRCPKCNSVVQLPVLMSKKPKIDLNISI